MMPSDRIQRLLLVFAILLLLGMGRTQAAEQLPPSANPESLQNSLSPDIDKDLQETSPIEGPVLVGPEAPEEHKRSKSSLRFTLKKILITPQSAFLSQQQLTDLVKQYEKRPISLEDLYQLVDRINQLYAQKGLITCRAILPPQRIRDGTVRIQLIEARLDGVEFEGRRYTRPNFLHEALHLKKGEILDPVHLADTLQRFNRVNIVGMTARLKPGQNFGTTSVHIKLIEPPRFQSYLLLNNAGARSTGEYQLQASQVWNQPRGKGDRLVATVLASQGVRNLTLGYQWPIASDGRKWVFSAGIGSTQINNGPFKSLGIEGHSRNVGIRYIHPFYIDAHSYLAGMLGGDYQASDTDISSAPLSRNTIRSIWGGLTGEWTPARVKGLTLNGQLMYKRAMADTLLRNPDINLVSVSGNARYHFDAHWFSQFQIRYQWADSAYTPPSLQIQFGGLDSVPGYEPSEISAETGYGAQARLGRYFMKGKVQLAGFYAMGESLPQNGQSQLIASTGLTMQWRFFRWRSVNRPVVSMTLAHPLETVRPDLDDWRVYAEVNLPFSS